MASWGYPNPERRRHPRFPLRRPIEFSGDLVQGEGTAVDISNLGCKVECDLLLEAGTYLDLRIHLLLLGEEVPLKIELAVVRWSMQGVFGTEFMRIHHEQQEWLDQLIRFLEMLPKSG